MSPDDPRHGSNAGYIAGCRETCCRSAHAAYRRSVWRKRYARRVGNLYVDSIGTRRRVQALARMGWRLDDIDAAIPKGVRGGASIKKSLYSMGPKVHVDTARAVAEVYERLSMRLGPSDLLRTKARNWGWYPPLCWDDIDDPASRPTGMTRAGTDYDRADLIDEATVLRILSGEVLPANAAEKREVMRRWLAAGNSERSLCERMGWKDGRYVTRDEDAA